MVKYKVNFIFKDIGKSLNEMITEVLKLEIKKNIDISCNIIKMDLSSNCTHYSQMEELLINDRE